MTMNGYNKIDYAVNIVEAYRHAKGLSGEEVAKLFGDAGVFKFLEDFGDTLHCQSDEATIAEIDDFIKAQTPSTSPALCGQAPHTSSPDSPVLCGSK